MRHCQPVWQAIAMASAASEVYASSCCVLLCVALVSSCLKSEVEDGAAEMCSHTTTNERSAASRCCGSSLLSSGCGPCGLWSAASPRTCPEAPAVQRHCTDCTARFHVSTSRQRCRVGRGTSTFCGATGRPILAKLRTATAPPSDG